MKFNNLVIHNENKIIIAIEGSRILISGNVQLKFNLVKDEKKKLTHELIHNLDNIDM